MTDFLISVSYFTEYAADEAKAVHVLNTEMMEQLLRSAPCRLAAFSGYGFAISSPKGTETPHDVQKSFRALLEESYEKTLEVPRFAQNHTTLECFIRKEAK